MTVLLALLLTLFISGSSAPGTGPDRTLTPVPGAPRFAYVTALEGLPPDSLGGREFRVAFNSAFVETEFSTERESVRPGEMLLSVPISNHFRLLHGSNNADAWQVQVSLTWGRSYSATRAKRSKLTQSPRAAAPRDTSVEIVIFALSPEAVAAGARVVPDYERLVFRSAAGPPELFARNAGRAVALLTLELLHHLSEDLAQDERLRLDGATRVGPRAGPLIDEPLGAPRRRGVAPRR